MKCKCLSILTSVWFAVLLFAPSFALAQTLGAAESFAVLGGSAVTNTGSSVVRGNVGISPNDFSSITGFPPGSVFGTTYAADGVALDAQNSATTYYNSLQGRLPVTEDLTGVVLGAGRPSLLPGTYSFSSSAQLTGELTLNGGGDPNAVWVFQIATTLTTASGARVTMSNSGSACNVHWQVGSSATLGTTTSFAGNIVALTSITLNTGATVTGRTLARNGAVTLDSNTVNATTCGGAVSSSALPVPTLPEWAMIALMALLALAGFAAIRRRTA